MPPSAKRQQKSRREPRKDSSPAPRLESSPSRPSKRRKKMQDPNPAAPGEDGEPLLAADQSTNNTNEMDQLVLQITQHLLAPKEPVQASRDHANTIHEANKDGVKAYAKIAAQDWTYYITKLVVNIGRASEPAQADGRLDDDDDDDFVHIDLGPSKMVSRQHALIYFNSKEEKWFLEVKGRNGVKIDDALLRQGHQRALVSGEVLEIAGSEMMFVLPSEITPLNIQAAYYRRAGLSAPDAPPPSQSQAATSSPSADGPSLLLGGTLSKPQPIAPAPPDYKRPGTPPSTKRRAAPGSGRTPQHGKPLLMSKGEVDLSSDESRHIKPQYSYAQMISQAIMQAPDEKLNLNGIYNFIMQNYAYYRHQQPAGWQNSIRHNLSLNKAFGKVARSSDEPGKGMKWQIVPESREEMTRTAYKGGRGGHRGSSAPSSPSQLNYITQGPKDMATREPGSGRKRKASPPLGSPPPSSIGHSPQETPERSSLGRTRRPAEAANGSPLPRVARQAPGAYQSHSPGSASPYLQEDTASFTTPAPLRVHPKLAPPSTAQRPSQHMPTSSPAPFWKYADIGSTPLKPLLPFDLSPSKPKGGIPGSSSPVQVRKESPSRSPTATRGAEAADPVVAVEEDEGQGFDLAKGFQSIGSYHAPVRHGLSVSTAVNGHSWAATKHLAVDGSELAEV